MSASVEYGHICARSPETTGRPAEDFSMSAETIRFLAMRKGLTDLADLAVAEDPLLSDWRERAACKNMDTDMFIVAPWGAPTLKRIRAAEAICMACPVRAECLEEALLEGDEFAIRGGLTPRERRSLKRR